MKFTQMAHANEIERDWIVVDATDKKKVFGRIITEVYYYLRGKTSLVYTKCRLWRFCLL